MTDTPDQPVGMTDLEEVLRGPGGADARDQAVERVEAAMRRIHEAIHNGLPADEHKAAMDIREALAHGRVLLLAFPVNAAS